jgi:hypothetical protein
MIMIMLSYSGREKDYVSKYAETHYTTTQMCRKYDIGKEALLKSIPPPDVISPYGNKTRLWDKNSIIALLGSGKK